LRGHVRVVKSLFPPGQWLGELVRNSRNAVLWLLWVCDVAGPHGGIFGVVLKGHEADLQPC
jgi:hypothetical protein